MIEDEIERLDKPHRYLTEQPTAVSDAAVRFALELQRHGMTDAIVAGVGYVPIGKMRLMAEVVRAARRVVSGEDDFGRDDVEGLIHNLEGALAALDAHHEKDRTDG